MADQTTSVELTGRVCAGTEENRVSTSDLHHGDPAGPDACGPHDGRARPEGRNPTDDGLRLIVADLEGWAGNPMGAPPRALLHLRDRLLTLTAGTAEPVGWAAIDNNGLRMGSKSRENAERYAEQCPNGGRVAALYTHPAVRSTEQDAQLTPSGRMLRWSDRHEDRAYQVTRCGEDLWECILTDEHDKVYAGSAATRSAAITAALKQAEDPMTEGDEIDV